MMQSCPASFRYQNTSYFVMPSGDESSLLAFDAGWPCSLHEYARAMKATPYRFEHIRWAIVSHFHLDHAGLIRDFQDAGIQCLLFENQGQGIDEMEDMIAPKYKAYRRIQKQAFLKLNTSESRSFLAAIGIHGEVITSHGHSDDSVSLVTDDHEVLIGDLYPVSHLMGDDVKSWESWVRIHELGGKHIHPGHATPFELE
jgi:glyoxylase-like metal-dependent hydrolase (beta-lactamase superfamily II)